MTKIPSIAYEKVIRALQRDGWVVVRQKGSHIRLQKRTHDEVLKLTIPAHRPIKRSTLSHILKTSSDGSRSFFGFDVGNITSGWTRMRPGGRA